MRPTAALLAFLVVVPLAAPAAFAQDGGDEADPDQPTLTVLSPAPRVGDHTMVVDVLGIELRAPGAAPPAPANGTDGNGTDDPPTPVNQTAYLEYRLNGAPCAGICAQGAPYRTAATTFTFSNLQAGDRVTVELLRHNGTRFEPRIFAEQGVRLQGAPNESPSVAIVTNTPNAGTYVMKVTAVGFTIVAPTDPPLPSNRTAGHFLYTKNGAPCTGNCSGGAPAYTGADTFTFEGLRRGDRIAVELVNHDGSPFQPARRTVQVVTEPKILIGSGLPRAGEDYAINVTVSGFTLVEPTGQPDSAGTGHLHYLVCKLAQRTNEYEDCRQAPGDSMTPATSFRYTGLEEDQVLVVELVHNSHAPLAPPVRARIDVEDAAPQDPLAPGVGPLLALGLLAAAALVRRRRAA